MNKARRTNIIKNKCNLKSIAHQAVVITNKLKGQAILNIQ